MESGGVLETSTSREAAQRVLSVECLVLSWRKREIKDEMVRQAHHPEQSRRTNSNERNPKYKTNGLLPMAQVPMA